MSRKLQQIYAVIFIEQTILNWIRPRAHEEDDLQLQALAGGTSVLCAQRPSHRFLSVPSVRPVSLIISITGAVKNLHFCQAQGANFWFNSWMYELVSMQCWIPLMMMFTDKLSWLLWQGFGGCQGLGEKSLWLSNLFGYVENNSAAWSLGNGPT